VFAGGVPLYVLDERCMVREIDENEVAKRAISRTTVMHP